MTEPDNTNGLRLLSLDGGGIRGLSILLILKTIMYRIQREEGLDDMPLPCDYFDLIGGTSTGGIIALMLGRLRMSVDDAINRYDALAGNVFSEVKDGGGLKKSATLLENTMKGIVKSKTGDSEARLLDDGVLGGICNTFVCAMNAHNMNARQHVLFRTYTSRKEPPISCAIWQAARATSAAPTFFDRIYIGPPRLQEPYIDGDLGHNNPTDVVLREAKDMFQDRSIACIISIGTGKLETIALGKPGRFEKGGISSSIINAVYKIATDCEETAQKMEREFKDNPKFYFRFNVEQGLQTIKPEDWDQMGEISAHTRNYMQMHEIDLRLSTAVEVIRAGRRSLLKMEMATASLC